MIVMIFERHGSRAEWGVRSWFCSLCPHPLQGQGEYGKGEDGILRGVYFKHFFFFFFPFSKKMKAQTERTFA